MVSVAAQISTFLVTYPFQTDSTPNATFQLDKKWELKFMQSEKRWEEKYLMDWKTWSAKLADEEKKRKGDRERVEHLEDSHSYAGCSFSAFDAPLSGALLTRNTLPPPINRHRRRQDSDAVWFVTKLGPLCHACIGGFRRFQSGGAMRARPSTLIAVSGEARTAPSVILRLVTRECLKSQRRRSEPQRRMQLGAS